MRKNAALILTLCVAFFASAHASAGNPECFTVTYEYNKKTYKNTKTILKKGKKTIAEYATNYKFVMQLTSNAAYFASDDRTTDVIIGCDGKIMLDSISQVNILINTEGSGGDRTEQRMGYVVTKNEQKTFYDMSDKAMKNAVFDDVKLGPYTQPNQRPDLLPNVPKLILLYVAKKTAAKTLVWGVYDLSTQQFLMQPRYQLAEGTTSNNFYFAQWGFIQFVNPETNKARLYNFFDTPVANTEGKIWMYETNMPRTGTPHNKMVLDVDGKFFREDGSPIAFPRYDDIYRCGFYAQLKVNKKVGLYDFEGREIVPIQFDELSEEYCRSYQDVERYMPVKQGEMWGYYDTKAKKMATDFKYRLASIVSKGVATVRDVEAVDRFLTFDMDSVAFIKRSQAMQLDFIVVEKEVTSIITYLGNDHKSLIVKTNSGELTKSAMSLDWDKLAYHTKFEQKKAYKFIDDYKTKWGKSLSGQDESYFSSVDNFFDSLSKNMKTMFDKIRALKE